MYVFHALDFVAEYLHYSQCAISRQLIYSLFEATWPVKIRVLSISGAPLQVQYGIDRVEASRGHLYQLAQGGTAVGTGLNAKKGFAEKVAAVIGEETGYPFITAPNK